MAIKSGMQTVPALLSLAASLDTLKTRVYHRLRLSGLGFRGDLNVEE
jgi:hypothetical protein